jgi:hypothetical protein
VNEELRYQDGSDAAVRAAARRARREWWITQCRNAISDARARVPPEPSFDGETDQPNQHPSPEATDDDDGGP